MIPKVIHYCWFGKSKKPKLIKKCIKSWQKYCPDYTIIEWNENNINIADCPLFARQAYKEKKYAFVTDYVRLKVLYEQGGIYLDTDVELIKPLNELLKYKFVVGFEKKDTVQNAICLSESHFPFLKELMNEYENLNDSLNSYINNTIIITDLLTKNGLIFNNKLQTIKDCTVLPKEYFYPKDNTTDKKYKKNITKNTVAIHHYTLSWVSFPFKLIRYLLNENLIHKLVNLKNILQKKPKIY